MTEYFKKVFSQKEPQQGRHYSSHTLSHYPHSFTLDQTLLHTHLHRTSRLTQWKYFTVS